MILHIENPKDPTKNIRNNRYEEQDMGRGLRNTIYLFMCKVNNLQGYIVQHGIEPIFYNNYKWSINFKMMNHYVVHLGFIYINQCTSIKRKWGKYIFQ